MSHGDIAVSARAFVDVMTSLRSSYGRSVEVKLGHPAKFNVHKDTAKLHPDPQINNH